MTDQKKLSREDIDRAVAVGKKMIIPGIVNSAYRPGKKSMEKSMQILIACAKAYSISLHPKGKLITGTPSTVGGCINRP